ARAGRGGVDVPVGSTVAIDVAGLVQPLIDRKRAAVGGVARAEQEERPGRRRAETGQHDERSRRRVAARDRIGIPRGTGGMRFTPGEGRDGDDHHGKEEDGAQSERSGRREQTTARARGRESTEHGVLLRTRAFRVGRWRRRQPAGATVALIYRGRRSGKVNMEGGAASPLRGGAGTRRTTRGRRGSG